MNRLLAAERRARTILFECQKYGLSPEFDVLDNPDGHALLAAARAAPCLGLTASVRLAQPADPSPLWERLVHGCLRFADVVSGLPSASEARGVGPAGQTTVLSMPDAAAAWAVPLRNSAPRVVPDDGRPAIAAALCRDIDRVAIEQYRIPGVCLMENAAIGAVAVAMDMLEGASAPRVVVAAGGGNNGGDGFAVARGLASLGIAVEVALLKPAGTLGGDALVNYMLLGENGIAVRELAGRPEYLAAMFTDAALIVDALLGTGFHGALTPAFLEAIERINASKTAVLSLDLPSGLNADTGETAQAAVAPDRTVTFAAPKPALRRWPLYIADIGVKV